LLIVGRTRLHAKAKPQRWRALASKLPLDVFKIGLRGAIVGTATAVPVR